MFPLYTILHPTDFSEQAENARRAAEALAHDYNARLVLVHVMQPPPLVASEMGVVIPDLPDEPAALWARLNAMAPEGKFCVERFLLKGEPVEQIVRMAKEEGADLIVMGTHGRSGLSRVLMGSVAEWVLRRAPCPVLTVREPVPVAALEPEPAVAAP
jgi:nucleotide-binding universal stress UspA family protein